MAAVDARERYESRKRESSRSRRAPFWWLGQRDPLARFTGWLAVATVCLCIATLASVVALIITDRTLKNTAERQLRAYIAVENMHASTAVDTTVLQFFIVNNGQTPARKLIGAFNYQYIPFGLSLPPTFNYEDVPQGAFRSVLTLNPGAKRTVVFVMDKKDVFDLLRQKKIALFVYGHFDYLDVFDLPRRTEFNFQIIVPSSSEGSGSDFVILPLPAHSDAS
jgi:hypothetical protein